MTLIPLESDKKTLSLRFRKADYFLFLENEDVSIVENQHKKDKSREFFAYFTALKVKRIYLKGLGYKTFLKLQELGVEVYLLKGINAYQELQPLNTIKINGENAQEICTLGHGKKN